MCNCGEGVKDMRYVLLEKTLADYRHKTGKIIPVLQETQGIFGYIPEQAIRVISRELNIPSSEIYGVATFYGQFHLRPRGKNILRVCTGIACHVRGGGKILEAVTKALGLKDGMTTTEDLLFTIEPVACLGACGMAPVMMINDEAYGRLTPEEIPAILARYEEEDGGQKCIA
ncbi:MAG: NADH-quinone oxidoreductase subunit NuoE [Firmicutes bacterium]|nr:NADH-quinone oxidoreductase subunit NuoE [Bacillota bacterium]